MPATCRNILCRHSRRSLLKAIRQSLLKRKPNIDPDAEKLAAEEFDPTDYLNGSKPPLQVLLVEDDPVDAALLEAILRPLTPLAAQIVHVTNREEAERAVALGFDVVVLDLNLPDSAGMATLRAFREACPDTPVCVCSGVSSLGADWDQLAQQSLPKHEFARLSAERARPNSSVSCRGPSPPRWRPRRREPTVPWSPTSGGPVPRKGRIRCGAREKN